MELQSLEKFTKLFMDIKNQQLRYEEEWENLVKENVKGDDVDQVLDEREKAFMLKLKGRRYFYLKKVDQALDRIKNGSFGECQECGENINSKRLEVRPTATLCIQCKEEEERSECHILYGKKSHTHGRELEAPKENSLSFGT